MRNQLVVDLALAGPGIIPKPGRHESSERFGSRETVLHAGSAIVADECPECGGAEIRLVYKRSTNGPGQWQGRCWDCRDAWTADWGHG